MTSGPSTTFTGTTGPQDEKRRGNETLNRILMYAAFIVLFPLAIVSYLVWIALFNFARTPWWVPWPVAGVMLLITTRIENSFPGLVLGHVESWGFLLDALDTDDGVGPYLQANLVPWLFDQLWLSAIIGTIVAGLVIGWRWLRRPRWESRNIRPGFLLKKRFQKTSEEIASGRKSPEDGVTVGVAADLRDKRFAGGAPGAPYGRRVVLEDDEGAGHTLVVGGSGAGKALDISTPIPTPFDGFVPMGELRVGDVVLDEYGLPTKVVGAFDVQYERPCFEIEFHDGSVVVCDEEHLWRVRNTSGGRDEWHVQSTAMLLRDGLWDEDGRVRWVVPPVRASEYSFAHSERAIFDIRPVESRPVRCIKVDSRNSVFLAGTGYVPTHNTTTMLVGMRDVMRRGHGLVVVDCKGSPDLPPKLAAWAERYGRDFLHWSFHDIRTPYQGPADGPAFYDPIGRGDPTRKKDLILGSQSKAWQGVADYYKSEIGNYLQTLFTVSDLVPPEDGVDSFSDLAELLSPPVLLKRASPIPRDRYPDLWKALEKIRGYRSNELSAVDNMYSRLNTITASVAGPWMKKDPEGKNDIDFMRAAHEGQVVLFSLDANVYEEQAAIMAALIVQDLKTVSSNLRDDPAEFPVHIYIDEFSAVDATNIAGLLSKARDSRMAVTLSTQTLSDLKRSEPHFDTQVIGVVSSFLIHRTNQEEEAREYAGLSGITKRMSNKMSVEQTTGRLGTLGVASATGTGYISEEEQYRVEPGVFQDLGQGQCVFVVKMPQVRYVSYVQVIPENEMLAELHCDPPVEVDVDYDAYAAATIRPRETFSLPKQFDAKSELPHPNQPVAALPPVPTPQSPEAASPAAPRRKSRREQPPVDDETLQPAVEQETRTAAPTRPQRPVRPRAVPHGGGEETEHATQANPATLSAPLLPPMPNASSTAGASNSPAKPETRVPNRPQPTKREPMAKDGYIPDVMDEWSTP